MRVDRLTVFLMILILAVAAGCSANDSLTNLRGLLPRAEIPNVPEAETAEADSNQATDTSEPTRTAETEPSRPPEPEPPTASAEVAARDEPAAAPESQPPAQPSPTLTAASATQAVESPPSTSSSLTSGTISFTPVVGAPVDAVQPLSQHLGSAARSRGLAILQTASAEGDHILKGYFSASTDGDKTTVSYVWDVLDGAGNRLHRIRGQEVAQGNANDPWEVVQASTMESIAVTTIDEYLSWRDRSGS